MQEEVYLVYHPPFEAFGADGRIVTFLPVAKVSKEIAKEYTSLLYEYKNCVREDKKEEIQGKIASLRLNKSVEFWTIEWEQYSSAISPAEEKPYHNGRIFEEKPEGTRTIFHSSQ
jgi:hypothetical protein